MEQRQTNKKGGTCLTKKPDPGTPEEYRPLTLLNANHKLLTRIIANRLQPWMGNILHSSQHCGRNGHTIFEAVATIRHVVS